MKPLLVLLSLMMGLFTLPRAWCEEDSFERVVDAAPIGRDIVPDPPPDVQARYKAEWLAKLARFPDVNARLVARVEREFQSGDTHFPLSNTLYALGTRTDLSESQLDSLTSRVITLGKERREWSQIEKALIRGTLHVLQWYPSAKHEALCIRYAGDDDPVTALSALNTLAEIGTENALAAARGAVKRRHGRYPGATDTLTKYMEAALEKFERRLAGAGNFVTPTQQGTPLPNSNLPGRDTRPGNTTTNEKSPTNTIVVVVVVLAGVGLLWLLLKQRK